MKNVALAFIVTLLFLGTAKNVLAQEGGPFNEADVKNVFAEFSTSFSELPIAKQLIVTVIKYSLVVAFVLAIASSVLEIASALANPEKSIGLFNRIAMKWILWLVIGGSLQIANYIFEISNKIVGTQ